MSEAPSQPQNENPSESMKCCCLPIHSTNCPFKDVRSSSYRHYYPHERGFGDAPAELTGGEAPSQGIRERAQRIYDKCVDKRWNPQRNNREDMTFRDYILAEFAAEFDILAKAERERVLEQAALVADRHANFCDVEGQKGGDFNYLATRADSAKYIAQKIRALKGANT